jgi:hypothetical protein
MTGPTGAWDDPRLEAAFRSRFDAAPPTGLVDRVTGEIGARQPLGWLASLRTSTLGLAGIAAIIAAVLIGSQLGIGLPRAGASAPALSGPAFSSPPNGAGSAFSPAGFPTFTGGLDVVTVDAAISARERGSGAELAVAGWYQMPAPKTCLDVPEVAVPLLEGSGDCSSIDHTWLMAGPESLITIAFAPSGGPYAGITAKAPSGPAVNVTFAGIWPPDGVPLPVTGGSAPTPVVFVGHFHDRRANLCSLDDSATCGRRFVVDAEAWVDGTTRVLPVQVDWRDGGKPDQTNAQLDAIASFLATHTWILSTRLASSAAVANLEPALAPNGPGELPAPAALTSDPLLWIATVVAPIQQACVLGLPCPPSATVNTYIIDSNGVLYVESGPTFKVMGPAPT